LSHHLLEVNGLSVQLVTQDGVIHAVNDLAFHLDAGETLGIVGESGSGKSMSMLALMRLLPQPGGRIISGKVVWKGQNLFSLSPQQMRRVRGREIAMIFQDPMTALNPVLTIGRQLTEALQWHLGLSAHEARQQAVTLLEQVGIGAGRLQNYPHQFSGGMRQRVLIAMSLACQPQLLIADEPTTALDVTIQAQIVDLLKHLRQQLGTAMIWVTHDLALLAGIADRIVVMYAGRVVEQAPLHALYQSPRHPYTLGLLQSLPRLQGLRQSQLQPIPGTPPDLRIRPQGCAFAPRCAYVKDQCWQSLPPLEAVGHEHHVACWVKPPKSSLGT
jgi:oligopeptide transport system ATP-binding protein